MADWLWWLLRKPALRPGEAGVEFALEHPLATWEWAAAAVVAGVVGWWCYRRLDGPGWGRGALAVVRAALLMLLVFLITGPALQKSSETVERDWVLVVADRSRSMGVADVPGAGARITRDAQAEGSLAEAAGVFRELAAEREVHWLGFGAGVYELRAAPEGRLPVELGPAEGRRSDLGAALERALAKAAARPISGIVVLSDGRASEPPPRALVRRMAAQGVPVFAVPLGSREAVTDYAVRSVEGPGVAFVRDAVPVQVVVERVGAAEERRVAVELFDQTTGRVLERREVRFEAGATGGAPGEGERTPGEAGEGERGAAREAEGRVSLMAQGEVAGVARWGVRVVTEQADLVAENNALPVSVELVDRPLRVVYFDGYPRWEYRYLKNLLAREKSISYNAAILSPGRRFVQEGNDEGAAEPTTPAEWDRYDVIVIGDVRPEVMTFEQLEQIRRRVSIGGAGLLWIAGQGATPQAWRTTPLADLLPFSAGAAGEAVAAWDGDVLMEATPLAERLGVLRLEEPGAEARIPAGVGDASAGWSRLRWAQRIDAAWLKPAAEVLALATPAESSGEGRAPSALVSTMRYGAGRVLYVATDEVWRWRYGRGEDLPERFWLQLIRLLGRESVARTGRPASIEVVPGRAEVGQAARVVVRLLDQSLLDAAPASLTVRLRRLGALGDGAEGAGLPPEAADGDAGTELVLRPTLSPSADPRAGPVRREFTGTWVPGQAGRFRATVSDAFLASLAQPVMADAEVYLPNDELRRPEADHGLLADLARETGGAVVAPESMDQLATLLPRREVRITGTSSEHTLWDTPLALLAVLTLLAAEWIGRRLIRLV